MRLVHLLWLVAAVAGASTLIMLLQWAVPAEDCLFLRAAAGELSSSSSSSFSDGGAHLASLQSRFEAIEQQICYLPSGRLLLSHDQQLPEDQAHRLRQGVTRVHNKVEALLQQPACQVRQTAAAVTVPGYTIVLDSVYIERGNLYHIAELVVPLFRLGEQADALQPSDVTLFPRRSRLLSDSANDTTAITVVYWGDQAAAEFESAAVSLMLSLALPFNNRSMSIIEGSALIRQHGGKPDDLLAEQQFVDFDEQPRILWRQPTTSPAVCFENAILPLATRPSQFYENAAQWRRWRQPAYERCGMVDGSVSSSSARKRLVILQRDQTRKILHVERLQTDLQLALPAWDVQVVSYRRESEVCTLVTQMATIDLLVTAHGFQEIFQLFLRDRVPVVELSPALYTTPAYARLAARLQQPYRRVMGRPTDWLTEFVLWPVLGEQLCRSLYLCRFWTRNKAISVDSKQVVAAISEVLH